MSEDLERRLADAQRRVRELSSASITIRLAAWEDVRQAERDLAAARGEQYADVIDIGPRWDTGAPMPHVISNGSRAFIVCLAGQPGPRWDGSYVTVAWVDDAHQSPFVVIELRGCDDIRFGGPNDEAISGHPLYGKGLGSYAAHEVFNSAWIEERIRMNSVHPLHSEAPFRELHHYVLLFHDEMLEALADGIEARPARGTLQEILTDLAGNLIDQPYRGQP